MKAMNDLQGSLWLEIAKWDYDVYRVLVKTIAILRRYVSMVENRKYVQKLFNRVIVREDAVMWYTSAYLYRHEHLPFIISNSWAIWNFPRPLGKPKSIGFSLIWHELVTNVDMDHRKTENEGTNINISGGYRYISNGTQLSSMPDNNHSYFLNRDCRSRKSINSEFFELHDFEEGTTFSIYTDGSMIIDTNHRENLPMRLELDGSFAMKFYQVF